MENPDTNLPEQANSIDATPQKASGISKLAAIFKLILFSLSLLLFVMMSISQFVALFGYDRDYWAKKRLLHLPARIQTVKDTGGATKYVSAEPMFVSYWYDTHSKNPAGKQYIGLLIYGISHYDGTQSMYLKAEMMLNIFNKHSLIHSLDEEDRKALVSRAGVEIGEIHHNPDMVFYDKLGNKKAVLSPSNAELIIEQNHIEYSIVYPLSDSIMTEWPDISYTAVGFSPFTIQGLEPQIKMGYIRPEHARFQRGLTKRIVRVSRRLRR